jgi:SAM-dependent methyltransferase
VFKSFEEFEPKLVPLLEQGSFLGECERVVRTLGILEPLTGQHIPPENLQIQGPNYRESLIAGGCLSRNRATLVVLAQLYGSLQELTRQNVYLVEAVSGFALWLQRHLSQLTTSEFLTGSTETETNHLNHQDLCQLTFASASFELVLCNELFEHVYDLDLAFSEIARVLRPGGRLVATFPLAFGQYKSIEKARWNPFTRQPDIEGEPDYHGDPIRPEAGALVYRVPGWEVLDQARSAGFSKAVIHAVASWKHGVLAGDLASVLVLEAQR